MIDCPIGYYQVQGRCFSSKAQAFLHATGSNTGAVTYHYYDEVWDTALKTYQFNPEISLESLYLRRVQQLRDSYDYLILNFSGGSDSTTILETFLKNNVKLDEIYVKWPTRLINSGIYVPNAMDKSPTNMLSEWDFTIKPKLDYVRTNFPEIKIVVDDWIDRVQSVVITPDLVLKQNHNFGLANFGVSEAVSESAVRLENQGRKVASIFGCDKPVLLYNSNTNKFSMCFADMTVATSGYQHAHGLVDINSRINFFYAPDMPELHLARCYAVASHMQQHKDLLPLIDIVARKGISFDELTKRSYAVDQISNSICYPNWDVNTFQVNKPNNFNKIYHPWHHWLHSSNEFDQLKKKLDFTLTDISQGISDQYKVIGHYNKMLSMKMVATKQFYLNL